MPSPTICRPTRAAAPWPCPAPQPAKHVAGLSGPLGAAGPAGWRRRGWLLALLFGAALPSAAFGRSGGLPIPLATELDPDDASFDPAGWWVSEKLDGVRAVWDGRQLRFRSGLPIAAPGWFLDRLPGQALDGELWLARGRFEALSGAVRRAVPDDAAWRALRYRVFELPGGPPRFRDRWPALQALARSSPGGFEPVQHEPLRDRADLLQRLHAVVQAGGEGLMLRHPDAPYAAGRSPAMRKLKPEQDAEAVVIGHQPGRGRHAGRLGALEVQDEAGRRFQIGTGFSDADRSAPPPVGARISYRYRGRTESGLPRFASFLRVRPEGV